MLNITPLLIAIQFLTRIPIKLESIPSDNDNSKSLIFYPVVGLIIGILLTSIYLISASLSSEMQSILVLLTWVLVTGGLHLDGLADTADAFVGGLGDREKTLEIMKDPQCGPMGVVSLVLILLLKFSVVSTLSDHTLILLLLAPIMARATILSSFLTTPYVRQSGLGSHLVSDHYHRHQQISLLITLLVLPLLFGWDGFLLIIFLTVVFLGLRKIKKSRINGMTGDTLGAQVEIVETIFLFIGIILLNS